MEKDYGSKIVLIGDSGVGKSSLVYQFIHKKNQIYGYGPTIGASFTSKTMDINGKQLLLQIWDTAGQERYRSMMRLYYKGSVGCLCVFDLTDKESFFNTKHWIHEYKNNNEYPNIILLIANKSDLPEHTWAISREEIRKFGEQEKCDVFYTDAINGKNVDEVFIKLAEHILKINNNRDTIIDMPIYTIYTPKTGIITNLTSYMPSVNTDIKSYKCKC